MVTSVLKDKTKVKNMKYAIPYFTCCTCIEISLLSSFLLYISFNMAVFLTSGTLRLYLIAKKRKTEMIEFFFLDKMKVDVLVLLCD